jgi:hypothetical protein
MKHATDATLDTVEDLLEAARRVPGLTEKKRGVFYRKQRAFLHFHEDAKGMFADLRLGDAWERHHVSEPEGRQTFLKRIEYSSQP